MKELDNLYAELDTGVQCGDVTMTHHAVSAMRNMSGFRNGVEAVLHLAIKSCNLAAVQVLLQAKADVNYCDAVGRRAIHAASESGDLDILRAIVNRSPINVVDMQGISPLHACIEAGHQVIQYI